MTDREEGTLTGRGERELLPERGDPFASPASREDGAPASEPQESTGPAFGEANSSVWWQRRPSHPGYPFEDHGMRAVGPPLMEDLMARPSPMPRRGPALPGEKQAKAPGRVLFSTMDMSMEESRAKSHPGPGSGALERLDGPTRLAAEVLALQARVDEQVSEPAERERWQARLEPLMNGAQKLIQAEDALRAELERLRGEMAGRREAAPARPAGGWFAYQSAVLLLGIALALLADGLGARGADLTPLGAEMLSGLLRGSGLGAAGGALAAMIGLATYRRVGRGPARGRRIWYALHPWIGLPLGAGGLLAVEALLAASPVGEARGLLSHTLPAALAFLLGFEQGGWVSLWGARRKILG